MTTICIFGGSRDGNDPAFRAAAEALGRCIGERGLTVVYGGGCMGMMGAVADAALAHGARVVGIVPGFLNRDGVVHEGLTELVVVDDLFERKARMIEDGDAFIGLPGGLGTLDELLEVITWRQLGRIERPIGVLDPSGFYESLFALCSRLVATGFIDEREIDRIERAADPDVLLDTLLI